MKTIRDILKITHIHKSRLLIVVVLIFASSFSNIIYLKNIEVLINSVVQFDLSLTVKNVISLIFITLLNIIINRIKSKMIYEQQIDLETNMRSSCFRHLLDLNLCKLGSISNSDLIERYKGDIDSIVNFTTNTLLNYLSTVLNFILLVIYILSNNASLVIVLAISPILFFVTKKLGEKNQYNYENRQKCGILLDMKAKDVFENFSNIRVFGTQRFFQKKYNTLNNELIGWDNKISSNNLLIWISSVASYQTIYLIVYVLGGILAFKGLLSFGVIVSLFLVIDPMIEYIQNLPGIIPELYKIRINVRRYQNLVTNHQPIESIALVKNSNDPFIEIKGLSYSYPDSEPILQNINLNFQINERIAIVGEKGSGKSTLIRLIMGYDNNYFGSIKIAGNSNKNSSTEAIREYISYLPQDIILLDDKIITNIQITSDSTYSYETIMSNSILAEIYDDISNMEHGLDTVLENGNASISGGQKQRIGILIALLKNKPFVIFDESFSALDYNLAERIIDNINNNKKQGLLVITHNTSSNFMRKFDRIIVMDNGKIVANGTYDEIKSNDKYKTLKTR